MACLISSQVTAEPFIKANAELLRSQKESSIKSIEPTGRAVYVREVSLNEEDCNLTNLDFQPESDTFQIGTAGSAYAVAISSEKVETLIRRIKI